MNDDSPDAISRRKALATAVAGAAMAALPGCEPASAQASGQAQSSETSSRLGRGSRMPVVFLPHGGGPWPFVNVGFGDKAELDQLASYLKSLKSITPARPKALLVISAHWEEPVATVMNGERPPLLFDYYGFPEESYRLTWPAPGHPELASRVQRLLEKAGFATASNGQRGYDHGTFVPLKLTYPEADVPVVQLSLKKGLDPAEHLAMGRALAPLRDEGVFIVGSGMTYHNLRAFGAAGRPAAAAFDAWLNEAMALPPAERAERLVRWSQAPAARVAHPREEHLLPLMVVAGAAGDDMAKAAYNGSIVGLKLSAFHFG